MRIGYKEWSLVCEALGAGRQTILLRSGGIAEGREGFAFKYRHFYLFPTLFHQQEDRVLWSPLRQMVRDEDGSWLIHYEAEVVGVAVLQDWERVQALQPFHIWKESVIRERFEYRGGNRIHAALVRVKKLGCIRRFAETPELGGCRSWVEYSGEPSGPDDSAPVLQAESFREMENRFRQLVGPGNMNNPVREMP